MQIKSNKRLNEELIKASKVCIAGLIAVYISNELGYSRASTMTITVFLLLVSYPAASSSRGYFKQRFLANIYALCITAIIHPIFNGNLYGLPIIFFIIIITYDMFKLSGKISIVSCATGSLLLYINSDMGGIVSRFFSIIIGSVIAIIVNEIILPINSGDVAEKSLMKISTDILLNMESLIKYRGIFGETYSDFNKHLQALTANLVILEKDINIISGGFHLKEHSNKLKKYNQLQQVAIAADNYLKIISELNDDFVSLEQIDRDYIIEITEVIYESHKNIIEGKIFDENINLKIDSNRLDMSQHANILITSRLIEYLNKINEIED
ncbi:FUSC family protein [Clostridium gasigenes]|uniref:aromatic acid exporter family protein n=1 Tax=Clostridium gasigenes TaxID=94869 RepID=UPI001C0D76FD|nr:aromatic acid exporter family protein [Clostridium gasigenes]MBU3132334.1 FUSC family protein [Clostridium gasigenes]